MNRKNIKKIFEWYGWVGAVGILLAFFLVSFGYVHPQSTTYQIINLISALGIALNALIQHAYPSVALNFAYVLIALTTLVTILNK